MVKQLLLGSAVIVANLAIQIWAVALVVRFLRGQAKAAVSQVRMAGDIRTLGAVMMMLLLGHLLQFATWAVLFVLLGEFADFATAFYHSAVNFTSLGYGDIVMSGRWRLLGPLEAANGVLMFGLTAGVVLTVMTHLLHRRAPAPDERDQHAAGGTTRE
jgi:hypothetical protein